MQKRTELSTNSISVLWLSFLSSFPTTENQFNIVSKIQFFVYKRIVCQNNQKFEFGIVPNFFYF